MKDSRTSSIVLHNLLIAVLAFIWLVPIIWLVCTSFSAYSGMNTSTFFPKEWSITNYLKLFHPDSVSQFPQWFLNTFIIACFTCVISTMFVLMVAYATSVMRFNNRSKNSLTSIGTPLKKSLFCIKQYNIKCFYLF